MWFSKVFQNNSCPPSREIAMRSGAVANGNWQSVPLFEKLSFLSCNCNCTIDKIDMSSPSWRKGETERASPLILSQNSSPSLSTDQSSFFPLLLSSLKSSLVRNMCNCFDLYNFVLVSIEIDGRKKYFRLCEPCEIWNCGWLSKCKVAKRTKWIHTEAMMSRRCS